MPATPGGLERLGARRSFASSEPTLARAGQSATFLGVRDFRPGDDLRRVHWPATARCATPMIKEFELDLTPYFTLFLDLERSHLAGTGRKSTREHVVRTAASLLASAARRGDAIQLFGEGRQELMVPPGRGELQLAFALDRLIRVRQDGTLPLLRLAEREEAALPRGSTAALLSATLFLEPEELAEVFGRFRARGVQPALVAVDMDSFLPIDRRPRPREEVGAQAERLRDQGRTHQAPTALFDADHDLGEELAPRLARGPLMDAAGREALASARLSVLYLLSLLAAASAEVAWRPASPLRLAVLALALGLALVLGALLAQALSAVGTTSLRRRARVIALLFVPIPSLLAVAPAWSAPGLGPPAASALLASRAVILLLSETFGVELLALWGAFVLSLVAAAGGELPGAVGLTGYLALAGIFFSLDGALARLAPWPYAPAPAVGLALAGALRLLAPPVILLGIALVILPAPSSVDGRGPVGLAPAEIGRAYRWLTLVCLVGTGSLFFVFRWLRGRHSDTPPLVELPESHVEAEELPEEPPADDARYEHGPDEPGPEAAGQAEAASREICSSLRARRRTARTRQRAASS